MNDHLKRKIKKKPRVRLTKKDLALLYAIHGSKSAAKLAERTGLPYMLVYNVVRRRSSSVSDRQYTILFGKPAPPQSPMKKDGAAFRAMAHLWLYLNQELTKADLYRELFDLRFGERTDHRIFNGKIGTIDAKIEHRMREKFLHAGIDQQLLDQWLLEFEKISEENMIPYARIRPILKYLQDHLGIPPNTILQQPMARYEKGELHQVSKRVFEAANSLKRRTINALQTDNSKNVEKIRESIIGKKIGYTLFSDIEEELCFLCKHTGKSAKGYLGRSLWTYKEGKAKRISDERAKKIEVDVDHVIRASPGLLLQHLPKSRYNSLIQGLMDVLSARVSQLLLDKEGAHFEKKILKPIRLRRDYMQQSHGFTPFDMAYSVLGMRQKAFDLMVAENSETFRTVGKFNQRWYLSDLYLKEVSQKKEFKYVSAKYDHMTR